MSRTSATSTKSARPDARRVAVHAAPGDATRLQMMDTAERLFAERGLHGVTQRDIVAAAGVNLAAINYHFRSKELLFEAVFERAALRFSDELDRALDDLMQARGARLDLSDLIRAFIKAGLEPTKFGRSISSFLRLRAWAAAESSSSTARLLSQWFDRGMERYMAVARRLLPNLEAVELAWRFHVLIATLVFTANHAGRVKALSGGAADAADVSSAIEALIAPLVGAFEATNTSRATRRSRVAPKAGARER